MTRKRTCFVPLLAAAIWAIGGSAVPQETEPVPIGVAEEAEPTLRLEPLEEEPAPPPPVQNPEAALPASPNPHAGLSLESLTATRELPLFTPSRTAPVVKVEVEPEPEPEAPEPEPEVQAPPEPPPFRLVGVVMTASEQVAILANEGTGEIQRLRPGETYEDWALEIVDARTVAFSKDEQRELFKMFEPGATPPPAPGARTPVPEEALQNPGAMFGGGEGEFNGNSDQEAMDGGGTPGPDQSEINPMTEGFGGAEGIPEGALDDRTEPRTPQPEEPTGEGGPANDSVFIPGQPDL